MNIRDVASPRRFTIANSSPAGGGLELAAWDFGGDGPLALLHHANGMCAATWGTVAANLAKDFRVIALDARGHGDSTHLAVPDDYAWSFYVDDLIALARELIAASGTERIALGLGSSFGGIVTAAAEAAAPGLFERIVMLDPPIHPTPDMVDALGLEIPAESGQREMLVEMTLRRRAVWPSRALVREKWVDKPLFANWRPEAFALYVDEGFRDLDDGTVALKCDPAVEAHIFATTGSLSPMDYAPAIRVPVSMVRAADGDFPDAVLRAVSALMPAGSYAELAGGHLLPLENPQGVVQHVRQFCALA